jgi:hypothetical protein
MQPRKQIHPSLLLVLAVGATLSIARAASAQSGYVDSPPLDLRYVPPEPTLEELQLEYDSIHIWAPAVGIPLSYFTAGSGAALMIAGSLDLTFCFTDAPCDAVPVPRTPGERAMIGAGATLMLAGVAGLIASAVQLRKKNRRRRALRRQIAAMRP